MQTSTKRKKSASLKSRSRSKASSVRRASHTKKGHATAKRSSKPLHVSKSKIKDKVLFELEHYPQTEEFTSSAACAMMVLKHLNPNFKMKKEEEYSIWQEAVNGSVWHGSKYGLAYSIAKRGSGAKVSILSNTKDEGYDRKLAVYENVNLDTLTASYNEIKTKSESMSVYEEHSVNISLNSIKKALSSNQIPIVLIDANALNPYLESSPHWVVVKGYDKDAFYINDPYSDSTITLDHDAFRQSLGYDSNFHMVLTDTRRKNRTKR
ncbi:MAG: peptidase C39 family protein [Candidatus Marsarchaeota archaeon]|nr:peptidase C39 family protein [Candidatus Marsarchaeota archaeon]MCL5413148.1 peptidase C39 family protein [Candidatus Marsarchaeota archaeon]